MFKKLLSYSIPIFYFLIITTLQTCWLKNNHILIKESQISSLQKYQFSVHPTSGLTISKQNKTPQKQTLFYGDFGMLRMYDKESVAVYEGIHMRIQPLIHQVPSLFKQEYDREYVLEIQIMYELTFGKMKDKTYKQIGMSYFIVGSNNQNQRQKVQSTKFVDIILNLDQSKIFKIEQYLEKSQDKKNKKLFVYKANNRRLERFLSMVQGKSEQCQDMLWIIRRDIIIVLRDDLKKLKERYGIPQFRIQQKEQETEKSEQKALKMFSIKLRNENKKQITISAQIKKSAQNSNINSQNFSQKQGNSCLQSDNQQQL